MRAARWLLLGAAQVLVGLVMAAATASGSTFLPQSAHAIALATGIALVAGGLALGLAPPFLLRETDAPRLGELACAAALVGDVAAPLSLRGFEAAEGIALLLVVAHLPVAVLRGRAYEGDPILAGGQPYRVGDRTAAACLAVGATGFVAAGALLVAPPRTIATSSLTLLVLLGILPLLVGGLVFLLPRMARAPLSGATVVIAALALGGLGAIGLAFAYGAPFSADFRWPGSAVAAGLVLGIVALLRTRVREPGSRFAALPPLLGGAAVLAGLAAALVFFAMLGGAPNDLTPLALDALLALCAVLAVALAVAAAPLLLDAPPRPTRWARWAAGLAIAGLFLVAPAIQYARSAFPGVALEILAVGFAAWGLGPAMKPSGSRAMRRR